MHTNVITRILELRSINYLATSSYDNNITLHSLSDFSLTTLLKEHKSPVTALLEILDKYLISADYFGGIVVWSLKSLHSLTRFRAHDGYITSLIPSNDQNAFISVSKDRQLIKWSFTSTTTLSLNKALLWKCTVDYIYCAIILQGKEIANATLGCIFIVNCDRDPEQKEVKCLSGKKTPITSMAQLANGLLLSGCWDGNVQMWDVSTQECLFIYKNPISYKVFSIVPLRNGKQVMITTVNTILFLNPVNWQCEMVMPVSSNGEDAIELSNGVISVCNSYHFLTLYYN